MAQARSDAAQVSGPPTGRRTNYRWVVLAIIFIGYVVCMADRSNVGALLPFIEGDYHISKTSAGSIASWFFIGYAISQIPAGLLMEKWGTRVLVSVAVLSFSVITFAMGFTRTAISLIVLRLLLGLTEGPTPVGMTSTINAWFPRHEKGIATGAYIASTQVAPIFVPALAVFLAEAFGWRSVFHWFAVPGVVVAIVFYLFVHSRPSQSPHANQAEVDYISSTREDSKKVDFGDMGWIDRVIRLRSIPALDDNKKVLRSWNVWGVTLCYFFMNNVNYGMLTWVPLYLKEARGYNVLNMAFMAAAAPAGGLVGALIGGWISDRIFRSRRKPTMMFTALATAVFMAIVLVVPNNPVLIGTFLFLTGFCLNIGWSSFTSYGMNLSTTKTYPFTISIINSGGNLGGFFAPIIVGMLLDATNNNYPFAFSYFIAVLLAGFALMFTLTEPRPHDEATA